MRIIATKESEMKKMFSDDFHCLWSVFIVEVVYRDCFGNKGLLLYFYLLPVLNKLMYMLHISSTLKLP